MEWLAEVPDSMVGMINQSAPGLKDNQVSGFS
jgi:hypothetical protein